MSIVLTPRRLGVSAGAAVAYIGPNWFASVMGTGIVATAASVVPVRHGDLIPFAVVMWLLAALLLVAVVLATAAHWLLHPVVARRHLAHPVMGHFYGAPAMALMTVGASTLLVGHHLIGTRAAVTIDLVLWPAGTLAGLWTMWSIPRRTLRSADGYRGPAFGGWLMPVVPPMVSAATGALLVPHLPASSRSVTILSCYVMFGVALLASAPFIVTIVRRALSGRIGAAATVPTLLIVLGPLGQSVTAAHLLGETSGRAGRAFGLAYGLPVLLCALAWLVTAAVLVVRAARSGLPFGLTWWSFTFPVGTVVTGSAGLATQTGSPLLDAVAVCLFVVLVAAWAVVAALTIRGVLTGAVLAPVQTA